MSKKPTFFTCEGVCGRTLRPARLKAADHPGTIAVHKKHKCRPCYSRPTGMLPPAPKTFPCEGTCGRTLRQKNLTKKEYPGTTQEQAQKMCHECWWKVKPAEPRNNEAESVKKAKAEHPELAAFYARIKRAGRKQPTRI